MARLLIAARNEEQVADYLPMFILMGVYTGARKDAILKLRWPDVDLKNRYIDFTKYDTNSNKKGAKIRIPNRLYRHLLAHKARGTDIGYVIHRNQKPLQDIKTGFAGACIRGGIENTTPHTLRHTCASWLIQNNVSTDKIAKYLGHTSPRMIEQTYGHLSPDHLDEVMEVFG